MILIGDIGGGLGNQIPIYLVGFLASKNLGKDLYLYSTLRSLEDTKFNTSPIKRRFTLPFFKFDCNNLITNPKDLKDLCEHNNLKIIDKHDGIINSYQDISKIEDNTFIQGNYTDFIIMNAFEIRRQVIDLFELKNDFPIKYNDILKKIRGSNSVFVHVRRSDALNLLDTFGVPNMKYYEIAFENISKRLDNPEFFIFSDDVKWIKKNFKVFNQKYNYTVVDIQDDNRDVYDFSLMRECKNGVLSSPASTFGRIAAYYGKIEGEDKFLITPIDIGTYKKKYLNKDNNHIMHIVDNLGNARINDIKICYDGIYIENSFIYKIRFLHLNIFLGFGNFFRKLGLYSLVKAIILKIRK